MNDLYLRWCEIKKGLTRKPHVYWVCSGCPIMAHSYAHDVDFNYIGFNTIGPLVRAEPVDVKEYTTGNVIEHNIMFGTGIHGRNPCKFFCGGKGQRHNCALQPHVPGK